MMDISGVTKGIVSVLIGVFVGFLIWNSLFGTTNQSVTDINGTLVESGYTTEAQVTVASWKLLLLGIPLAFLGIGVKWVIDSFA